MERVFIFGLMVENIKVNGKITQWMVMGCIHGMMVEDIKETIYMIKSMDLENIIGMTEKCIKDIGNKENSMVKEN